MESSLVSSLLLSYCTLLISYCTFLLSYCTSCCISNIKRLCNYSGRFCWKECAAGYLVFPYVPQRSNLWILEDSSNLLIFSAYIVSRNRSWDETVSFMAWNCEFHRMKLWVSWLETVSFTAWNCELYWHLRNVPHLACKVWVRSLFSLRVGSIN